MNKFDLSDRTSTTALKLLGDYHTLRIINALEDGPARFCNVQRALDNLNPVTLTNRLKKLEQAGLVDRQEDDETCVYYNLTSLGHEAFAVLEAFNAFSLKADKLSHSS